MSNCKAEHIIKELEKINKGLNLEGYYETQYEHITNAVCLTKTLKEALINVFGDFNQNISPLEVETILNLIVENLAKVSDELCELSLNCNYLYMEDKHICKQ